MRVPHRGGDVLVHLVPVLLGDGVALYGHRLRGIDLERMAMAQSGQNTDLRFSVLRGEKKGGRPGAGDGKR